MNPLSGLLILTGILYGLFVDGTFWKIYFVMVALYTVMVILTGERRDNGLRQTLLIATWDQPSDPTSYMVVDVNMTKALAYVKKLNEEQKLLGDKGQHLTMTNLVGHALAHGIYKVRRNMGRLMFGLFRKDKKLGTSVLVDVGNGKDLVPVTIWDGHNTSLFEFAKLCNGRVGRAKTGNDEQHKKQTVMANFIPAFLFQFCIKVISYIAINIGISIPALSARNDAFGHVVITNIGTMGGQQGFAPLCPPVHAIGFFCCGAILKKPIVCPKTGEIVVGDVMNVTMTGDHRFGDAAIWMKMINCFKGYLEDPENFNPADWPENAHWSEKKEN